MSTPLARTALLSMTLALSACSDKQEKAPSAPNTAAVSAKEARPPEELFVSLGCRNCHGPGSAFAPALEAVRGKPAEVIAMSILDMQKVRPGSMMPSYTGRLSTNEALALANWIKAGNPTAANSP
ncbi:cytochrome c [Vitiosangium sp. GDMCC 1.1324]|uniref:c-type cytochrome n=1 Tax=Vitiosangium sp. (strain GDMCC 1.1324) TaxID=2138576 RepID=UPI00130EE823|nr:cytochrome c [Vitiosangium sp. GDMCC 1.1324]